MVFLGTMMLGDETRALDYGRDPVRDVAGLLERVGPRRWRLEWAANWLIVVATGIIGVMGAIGSAYLIVVNARDFRLFAV